MTTIKQTLLDAIQDKEKIRELHLKKVEDYLNYWREHPEKIPTTLDIIERVLLGEDTRAQEDNALADIMASLAGAIDELLEISKLTIEHDKFYQDIQSKVDKYVVTASKEPTKMFPYIG